MEADREGGQTRTERCRACLEPIHTGARVCPRCQSVQHVTAWKRFADWLKWIGGIVTVISLVSGVISLNGLYREWRGKQAAVGELVDAAGLLIEHRAYGHALALYRDALALSPGSEAARHGQVDLAMEWLRDVRVVGDQTFSEIIDPLMPILHRGLADSTGPRRADILAHIGWLYRLKHRDVRVYGEHLELVFQRALAADPDNVFANAMYGYWLASENKPRQAGIHLRRAIDSGEERAWVRRLQINSLVTEGSRYTSHLDSLLPYMAEILPALNQMRTGGEAPPGARNVEYILQCYGSGYDGRHVEAFLELLPLDDHLATLDWLLANLDSAPASWVRLQGRYARARLLEATGDEEQALSEYRAIAGEERSREALNVAVDAGILRITGRPTPRALEREGRQYFDDPMPADGEAWQFHSESLLNFNPATPSKNLMQAYRWFTTGMHDGQLTERADEALELFRQARQRVRDWLAERQARFGGEYVSGFTRYMEEFAYYNLYGIWDGVGQMAIGAGQYDQAIAELKDLTAQEGEAAKWHPSAWYQMARAYTRRAAAADDEDARRQDIAAAVSSLQTAVDTGALELDAYSWETVKQGDDWALLQNEPAYQALIRGR